MIMVLCKRSRNNVLLCLELVFFFFSSRRRHTRCGRDWSSDVCSSDLLPVQACDLIVRLHRKGAAALRPGDFAASRALDRERFLFELDHFHRHFIIGHRGVTPDPADDTLLRAFYANLAEECDRLPRVYCHRDLQSRNLMVERGRLRLIDFQDARMGPYTYDAASLLRDSSLDLDAKMVEEMLDRLCRALGTEPEEFRRDFDLAALQRNLKDLGPFGDMA